MSQQRLSPTFVVRQALTKMPENQGRLSPFTSSSGQQDEQSDNFVEYYSKPSGGEDKMLDVNSSNTVDRGYEHSTSTEPDPTGTIAMQKFDKKSWKKTRKQIRKFAKASVVGGATYTKPAEQQGVGTYSTTANTTTDAPSPGDTTEPESVHKADDTNMQLCNCAGMSKCIGCACAGCQTCDGCEADQCQGCGCDHGVSKAATCDCCADCGPNCNGDCCDKCKSTAKADESEDLEKAAKPESDETDADEPDDDEDDIQKKEFSDARRKELARAGKAMDDGSYPIESVQDLKNAIRSWGRGGAKPEVKQHIISRARALGASDELPDDWKSDVKKSSWGNAFAPGIPNAALRTVFRVEE